jgi:hypothetical protein
VSATETRYGRRGGGWVPKDVTPGTGVADLARMRAEREAIEPTVPTRCDSDPEQLAMFE